MTRVTFVLVEKQFLTAASNWRLKVVITRVGKPPGSFQFFTLKHCKYTEIMYFNIYEVILKAVPQAAFCQCVCLNAALALPLQPCWYPQCALAKETGISVGSSVCEDLVRSPLAAAELSSGVRGAVSALVHSSPSWALALWQRWRLKCHSGNRHCFSYLDWRLFLVYLLNAFTLVLRMGRMGPVEEDHTCLKLQVEGNLSPCSSPKPVGGWMDCACHSLAPRSPARLPWERRWHWLVTCLLVSWFCACAYIQVLFPEGAVPAERFTHCSLLHPHSPVSVHRSSSPQHSGVRREEILSFLSRGELRTAVARRGGVFSAQV